MVPSAVHFSFGFERPPFEDVRRNRRRDNRVVMTSLRSLHLTGIGHDKAIEFHDRVLGIDTDIHVAQGLPEVRDKSVLSFLRGLESWTAARPLVPGIAGRINPHIRVLLACQSVYD